jgi:signal-transduction protein with cAMP-binding, CBS, and nucleotidyltransferase domain
MLHSVDLKDYIDHNPVTVAQDASLHDAAKLIIKHRISGLCVIDNENNLLGILSEMDCLQGILTATYNRTSPGRVSEFMTIEVDVAQMGESIVNIASEMLSKKQRRRPVTDNGKLIGQITCRQLIGAVDEFPEVTFENQ